MRRFLVLLAVLLAVPPAASAAPGQGTWTDPADEALLDAPNIVQVAAIWDGDLVAFGVRFTQSQIYSGDRMGIQIDGNRDGVADYQRMIECCPQGGWLGAWNGVGWNIEIPQSAFPQTFGGGMLQTILHRGEIGWPSGVLHFRAISHYVATRGTDLAPNAGWYVLPQEAPATAVGGASGDGTAPAVPAPAQQAPPPAPVLRLDAAKGRRAVRSLVRRRLGRRARIVRLRCSASLVCGLTARRGRWVYRGNATVRVRASGAYRATFEGRRTRRGCVRRCRGTKVRWGQT